MIRQDLHVHTTWCDGKNTPRELVEAALRLGMTRLGFSGHGYTAFDESYCMSQAGAAAYRAEIAALKEEYRGRIELLCGVEQDLYSTASTTEYDYVIGSAHYLKLGGSYYPVDECAEDLQALCRTRFGGDWYALTAAYFDTVRQVVARTDCDWIGHFDLICKYNRGGRFFDEADPRYVAAWRQAADALLATGRPFEINTGAIARGHRDVPYPAPPILAYLRERGARFVLSSDSHRSETLMAGFADYEDWCDPDWNRLWTHGGKDKA